MLLWLFLTIISIKYHDIALRHARTHARTWRGRISDIREVHSGRAKFWRLDTALILEAFREADLLGDSRPTTTLSNKQVFVN